MTFDPDRFLEELRGDESLATELADALVERGEPFRQAHERVGKLVQDLEASGRHLGDAGSKDLTKQGIDLSLEDLAELVDPQRAIDRRLSLGGTAWVEVTRQVEWFESELE